MTTFRRVMFTLCSVSAPLSLAACGEGYEMVMVRGKVPYVEERTAGPGVAYVRAHMLPEKTVVLPQTIIAPEVKDAEPIFERKMQKK